MNNYEHVFLDFQNKIEQGISEEEAIFFLHSQGLNITESMKAFVQGFGMSLGEAKIKVTAHPVWNEVVKAAQPLHNDISSMK